MNELVSVIIPNWNGERIIDTCLKSVYSQSYSNIEVIVVDNNSQDDSVKLIENNYPLTKVIKLNSNTGFSCAVNVGIKNSSGQYIVLLNNDTEVTKDWVEILVETFSLDQKIGIVTSKLINYYDRTKIDGAGDEMNIVGQARSRGFGESIERWNKPEYVFSATGGASIYKKEVFEKIGYFEETYYMYFEDADLCYRAQKAGILVFYQPNAVIYHMHRASSNKRKNLLEYLLYRNFAIFYLINTPKKLFFTRMSLVKFIMVFFHTAYYLTKKGYFREVVRAWLWLGININKIARLRADKSRINTENIVTIESWRKDKELKILGKLII